MRTWAQPLLVSDWTFLAKVHYRPIVSFERKSQQRICVDTLLPETMVMCHYSSHKTILPLIGTAKNFGGAVADIPQAQELYVAACSLGCTAAVTWPMWNVLAMRRGKLRCHIIQGTVLRDILRSPWRVICCAWSVDMEIENSWPIKDIV